MADSLGTDKGLEITVGGYIPGLGSALLSTWGWIDFQALESGLNTSYCSRIEDRLVQQFHDSPNLIKYICSLITPFQELEYVFGDLLSQRNIDNATGAQLDGLGEIVVELRRGRDDDSYREAIKFKGAINMSSGEAESIIAATKQLTGASTVRYQPLYPARIALYSDGSAVTSDVVRQLELIAPGGVAIELYSSYGSINPFAVAPEGGDVDPNAGGFNEPNEPDSGGQLTEKFT